MTLIHFRTVLLRTAALRCLAHDTFVSSDAHPTLPVAGQGIVAGKNVPAKTFVGLVSSVDFGVTLEIVATHKALAAMIALELTVTQVCLDVRLDVLFSAEASPAACMEADPFAIPLVRAVDKRGNLIDCDTSLVDGCMDSVVEVKVINGCNSRGQSGL